MNWIERKKLISSALVVTPQPKHLEEDWVLLLEFKKIVSQKKERNCLTSVLLKKRKEIVKYLECKQDCFHFLGAQYLVEQ